MYQVIYKAESLTEKEKLSSQQTLIHDKLCQLYFYVIYSGIH